MSSFESFENPNFKQAADKFNACGQLGVTDADHWKIGSTPPKILQDNPGKTMEELMSDEEIARWIKGFEEQIKEFSDDKYKDNHFVQSVLPTLIKNLKLDQEYLERVGRLSVEK